MSKIIKGITLDVGGSEARGICPFFKDLDDMITIVDITKIKPEDFRVKELDDPYSVIDIVEAPNNDFIGMMGAGAAANSYKGTPLILSNQERKTSNNDYYLKSLFVIAIDAMKSNSKLTTGIDQNVIEYVVVSCIPAKEHAGNKDLAAVYKAKICGTYTVKFPLIENAQNTVTFKILEKRVGVVPEGAVCISALSKQLTPEEISIIVDIGHVSMDIAVFRGKSLFEASVITSNFAGGTLLANIKSRLAEDDIRISERDVMKAFDSGIITINNKQVDISGIIIKEKKAFVDRYVKSAVIDALNASGLTMQNVNRFIPIGAVMNESDKCGSMIDYIVSHCGLSGVNVCTLGEDLRYVNITQASMFTRMLLNKVSSEMM